MARVGFAIAGAVIGSFFGPIGTQLGFAIGGLVGGMLFPAKLPPGPRINDLIVSTATNGAPIPFGYNQYRAAGNVIWAPPIVENKQTQSVKGGPKQTSFTYTASFAVAFCEGPAAIQRVWFDSKVVFDSRAVLQTSGKYKGQYQFTAPITASTVIAGTTIQVTSILNPPVGGQVIISGAPQGNGSFQVTASSPTQFSYFNPAGQAPGSSGTAALPPIKYPAPTIYPGTEAQGADPTIQAAVGAANCPAFRGLCYAVWASFPLNDFGNRIPNIRAEITSSTPVTAPYQLDGAAVIATGNQSTPITITSATPAAANEWAIYMAAPGGVNGPLLNNVGGSWALFPGIAFNNYGALFQQVLPNANPITVNETIVNPVGEWWSALIALFNAKPTIKQAQNGVTVLGVNPTWQIQITFSGGSALTAGNDLLAFVAWNAGGNLGAINATMGDTQGNTYNKLGQATNPGQSAAFDSSLVAMFQAKNVQGGSNTVTLTVTGPSFVFASSCSLTVVEVTPVNATSFVTNARLSDIVTDICVRSGLAQSDIDVTQLALEPGSSPAIAVPAPGGYVIARPSTAANCLKPLSEAFFFDAVESGGVIKFVPRGNQPITAITIPETDLGLEKDKFKVTEQLQMAQELPREVQVLFEDKNLDYQTNKTHKRRATRIVKTKNQAVFELAMVLDPNTGRQIAEKALLLSYLERHPYDFNLWRPLYMLFDPTDVIQFTYNSLNFVARIVKQDIGVDYSCTVSAVSENANLYQSTIQGSSGTGVTPAAVKIIPDTILFLFDIPLLQDNDAGTSGNPGIYFGMASLDVKNWPGGSLQKSADNVIFGQQAVSNQACNYGIATGVLPPPRARGALGGVSPWTWDTVSTLNVVMQNGVLAGTSDLNVYNGQNALLVGSNTGGWELIQFANAVQNPDGSFTISRLLRGRRGTEAQCFTHGAAEFVVVLNSPGVIRQIETTADLAVLRFYNAVSSGNLVDPTQSVQLTEQGNDLKPYAVTSVAGTRDQSGNLTVNWIRRTRIGGDWLPGIGTVALSESAESYDIDILTGPSGTVLRTFSAQPSPTLAYSAAQQITDFGGTPAQISMNIYQNSGVVGRGFVKSVTL